MDVQELWDAEAPTFDDDPDHGLHDPATREAWRRLLLAHLPPAPARVADLGCGTGTLGVLLAEEGYAVDCVDFSPAMVERARAKAAALPAVTVTQGDAGDPPLPPGAYDAVLCRHVLWTLPDQPAVLGRWLDLLADAGRLVLVEGSWSTGAGLSAEQTVALVRSAGRDPVLVRLTDPVLWGREIDDDRYLVTGWRLASLSTMKLSTRNQLPGTVTEVTTGEAMAVVKVQLDGGELVTSSITREAVEDLGLAEGSKVTVLIKSTEVGLAVE